MPLPQISLSKKLIVLLAMPAAVQLGIVIGLSALECKVQAEADRAEQARLVQDSINQLGKSQYRIMAASQTKALLALGLSTPLFGDQQGIYKQFTTLKKLLGDYPKDLAVVQKSEKSSLEAMAILQQLKEMYDRGDIQDRPERRPLVSHLRALTQDIVSPELIELGNHASTIVEQAPAVQQSLRNQARWVIGTGGVISLLLTILLALFLVRRVALRLERILDSRESLARKIELHGPDAYAESDEIAKLDQAFHEMAQTINEITAKQMAVVDNAGDMICSLDEDGKITSVNAAGGKLFGCHQAELIGKNYRDIVRRQDVSVLSRYLQGARDGAPGKPVQLRLVGLGGKVRRSLWVLWSARWSSSENQYFSVVHDLTQIQEAQRMKREIVALVSRELRAPLSDLQAFFDLLEEGSIAKIEDRGHRFVSSARRNTDQMLTLINDMIDLEQAKNGMLVLSAGELNLDNIIDRAQVVIGPYAEEKDIVLDCRRSGLKIKGEEDKLLRVFTNLLGNAVLYAPRESSILVVSKSQDSFAQVSISDKGPGMPPEQAGTIFDAFTTPGASDASKSEAVQGSGLGLAISKAFVELHGGTISVTSKVGDGTTIALTLPLGSTSGVQKAPAS